MGLFEGTAARPPSYILSGAQYQVIAPVVVAQLTSGSEMYVYRHGFLPLGTMQMQIEHLLDMNMISKVEVAA